MFFPTLSSAGQIGYGGIVGKNEAEYKGKLI